MLCCDKGGRGWVWGYLWCNKAYIVLLLQYINTKALLLISVCWKIAVQVLHDTLLKTNMPKIHSTSPKRSNLFLFQHIMTHYPTMDWIGFDSPNQNLNRDYGICCKLPDPSVLVWVLEHECLETAMHGCNIYYCLENLTSDMYTDCYCSYPSLLIHLEASSMVDLFSGSWNETTYDSDYKHRYKLHQRGHKWW